MFGLSQGLYDNFFSPTGNCEIDQQNTKHLFFDLMNSDCLHVVLVLTR